MVCGITWVCEEMVNSIIYVYIYIILYIYILYILIGGFNPLLKNMNVSWGYYSQYMESQKNHVPNHQPVYIYIMTADSCFHGVMIHFRRCEKGVPPGYPIFSGKPKITVCWVDIGDIPNMLGHRACLKQRK